MKLYTEEQVINGLKLAHSHITSLQNVFDILTPIELPSDEELRMELQFASNDYFFGAKWMKEQILNQNK